MPKARRLKARCAVCRRGIDDYASNRRKSKSGKFFCSAKCRAKGVAPLVSIALGGDGVKRSKKQKDALFYAKRAEKIRDSVKAFYKKHRTKILAKLREKSRALKVEVITAYGGKCSCCGERHIEFLTIDHINGDGADHRKKCGKGRGIYKDLKRRGFPQKGYRVLCFNCNISLGFYGYCPHQPTKRRSVDCHRQKTTNQTTMSLTPKMLAIDPGQSGGFAWSDGNGTVECRAMPETEGDVLDLLRSLRAAGINSLAIEDQVGCVGPNIKVSGTSMFKFGRGFGFILGAAQGMGYSIVLVRPQAWQKKMSVGKKKDHPGKEWKNHLKATAQRLFPTCTVTLATADALLIFASFKNT